MTKQFYRSNIEEVAADLKTDLNSGLSSEEASIRLNEYGPNELGETKHTSLAVKFLCQFKSFMIIVLIIAGIISGVVGYMNGEGFTDAIIILAIVLLNAVIGVVQEAKAEKSLDALKKMSAPHCKVLRDGKLQILESRYLVPGDIVEIETGDSVPADIRLTEAVNLKIQEAALTGESLPVEKNIEALAQEVPLGDRNDMAFQSCSVTYGRGRGIVTGTGTSTEVGRIASLLQAVPELKTPLQIRLDHLGKFLAWTSLGVCVLLFAIGLAYGHELLTMFMTAVSLAAAAIPEGLPAVSTIVLAVGVQRLAKRNAIVRNMPSVETLGSTTVICSDKTGTLTQNRMTVVRRFPENSNEVLKIAVLCNDGSISEDGRAIGDPTETALLEISSAPNKTELETKFPRVAEIPFDSERKLMTTIHLCPNGSYLVATKGGFDELLSRCSSIRLDAASRPISDSSSTSRPITESDHATLLEVNTSMATDALRVLCMAYKLVPAGAEITDILNSAESELIFAGMVGMIDPPRLEVRDAVAKCGKAGIRPVMITGDHKITAMAIARDLGIMQEGDSAYTGAEVEAMNEAQLKDAVRNASVFARVSPEHKLRIVKAFKDNGEIVAMTGDGVNDAPALKLADIGVAMGITGTDVAKESADVVLTDDNFATIVSSVEEGRRIYDNVLKSVKFLLSTNFGEVMLLFTAVVLNLPSPLLPIHILWINLVSDSLPALALGFDTAEEGIMRRKPIDPKEGIVNRHFAVNSILRGLLIAGLSLAAYFIGMQTSPETAMTMAFAVVALSQISILFCVRAGHNAIIHNLFTNKYLWAAVIFVLTLMLGVLLIPAAQSVFLVVPLSGIHWLWIAAFSIFPAFLIETLKFINSRTNGKLERCASY